MSKQGEIDQFWFHELSQPPRSLSPEEVKEFTLLSKELGYRGIAGCIPLDCKGKTVGELLRLIENSAGRSEHDAVPGPYVIGQDGSSVYFPDGVELYKRFV